MGADGGRPRPQVCCERLLAVRFPRLRSRSPSTERRWEGEAGRRLGGDLGLWTRWPSASSLPGQVVVPAEGPYPPQCNGGKPLRVKG